MQPTRKSEDPKSRWTGKRLEDQSIGSTGESGRNTREKCRPVIFLST